jgi:hypothetical protein
MKGGVRMIMNAILIIAIVGVVIGMNRSAAKNAASKKK